VRLSTAEERPGVVDATPLIGMSVIVVSLSLDVDVVLLEVDVKSWEWEDLWRLAEGEGSREFIE